MKQRLIKHSLTALAAAFAFIPGYSTSPAASQTEAPRSAGDLAGYVLGAGGPISGATVTLYAAGTGAPRNWHKARPTMMARSNLMAVKRRKAPCCTWSPKAVRRRPPGLKAPTMLSLCLQSWERSCPRRSRSMNSQPWPRRSPPRDLSRGKRSLVIRSDFGLRPGTFRTWWISRPARGAKWFWIRSTAPRPRRLRT